MARTDAKQPKDRPKLGALATRIAERFAGARDELGIDRLVSELGDVQRYDVVAALKELEKAGAGALTAARGGLKARFVWVAGEPRVITEAPVVSAPPSASKERVVQRWKTSTTAVVRTPSQPEPPRTRPTTEARPGSPSQDAQASLEHVFHLRPGFQASIRLPANVTRTEVDRFCQFLQAIPFERAGDKR